jgi:hypothetical protein
MRAALRLYVCTSKPAAWMLSRGAVRDNGDAARQRLPQCDLIAALTFTPALRVG